jgi:hypothetical protein
MAVNSDIIDTEYEQYIDDDERVLWSNTSGSKWPHLRLELLLRFGVVFPIIGIGLLKFVEFNVNDIIIIIPMTILGSWLLAAVASLEWPKAYILTDKRILLFHRFNYKILDYGLVTYVHVKKKKSGKADVVMSIREGRSRNPSVSSKVLYDVEDAETVSEILREKTDVVAKTRKKQEEMERWQQW